MSDETPQLDELNEPVSRFARSLMRRSELGTLAPVEPLIKDVLSLRASAVMFGPTTAGKTILGIGWACSVGTGLDWLGHTVTRCPAMYVVGEGAYGLERRVSAWELAWQTKVTDDDVIFSVKPDSLTERMVWEEMTAEAIDLGRRFILLDTFSSLAPDADETKDAPMFTRRLSDLAAAIDGTAVVVHHPGWGDSDRTRGGYQLEANVDEVLKVAGNGASDLVELTRKKVKEGPAGAVMWLRRRPIELGVGVDGEPFGSVVMEKATQREAESPMRDRIIAALAELGEVGATGPQLMPVCGAVPERRGGFYKALNGLVDEGLVSKEGRRGRERYRLTREGSQP